VAVDSEEELIVPEQLSFMSRINHPMFSMKVKMKAHSARLSHCQIDDRFDEEFIQKEILQDERIIQMVYVCGPERMYQETMSALRTNMFPESKIFLV
jgi:NAD(P)H-flavin reductase